MTSASAYRNICGSTTSSPIHDGSRSGVVLVGPVPGQDSLHEYVEMVLLKWHPGSWMYLALTSIWNIDWIILQYHAEHGDPGVPLRLDWSRSRSYFAKWLEIPGGWFANRWTWSEARQALPREPSEFVPGRYSVRSRLWLTGRGGEIEGFFNITRTQELS